MCFYSLCNLFSIQMTRLWVILCLRGDCRNVTRIQKKQILGLWMSELWLRCKTFSASFFTLRGEKNQVTFCLPCSISLGVTSLFCDVWGFSFPMLEFYSNILLFLGWVFSLNFWSFLISPNLSAGLVYGISLPVISGKCFAAGWAGVGMLVSSLLEMGTTTVHVIY